TFQGFQPFAPTDIFIPLSVGVREHRLPMSSTVQLRGGRSLQVWARLKQGISEAEARAELSVLADGLDNDFPQSRQPKRKWTLAGDAVQVTSEQQLNSVTQLTICAGIVVLIMSCFNVGTLLIARTASRTGEL